MRERATRSLLARIPSLVAHIENLRKKHMVDYSDDYSERDSSFTSSKDKNKEKDKYKDRDNGDEKRQRGTKRKYLAEGGAQGGRRRGPMGATEGNEAITATHSALGSPLDRHGCSVLLMQALLLAETVVNRAQKGLKAISRTSLAILSLLRLRGRLWLLQTSRHPSGAQIRSRAFASLIKKKMVVLLVTLSVVTRIYSLYLGFIASLKYSYGQNRTPP